MSRNRNKPLPIEGEVQHGWDELAAQFSLELQGDVIRAASFKASSCTALIAYCELLAESVTGLTCREVVARVRTRELALALPGVPAQKQDRALLATAALFAAVIRAQEGEPK